LLKNILEAALLTSQEPLSLAELKKLLEVAPATALIEALLKQLALEYSTRGIELTQVASGWRSVPPEMQVYLGRLIRRSSRVIRAAVMETLAIIAYRQPVTRGDIEEIRGVAVASPILKTLEARSWIEVIGTLMCRASPSCLPLPSNCWTILICAACTSCQIWRKWAAC